MDPNIRNLRKGILGCWMPSSTCLTCSKPDVNERLVLGERYFMPIMLWISLYLSCLDCAMLGFIWFILSDCRIFWVAFCDCKENLYICMRIIPISSVELLGVSKWNGELTNDWNNTNIASNSVARILKIWWIEHQLCQRKICTRNCTWITTLEHRIY